MFSECGSDEGKLFAISENGKMGLININGEMIVKPIYRDIWIHKENPFAVQAENGKWGYIDQAGKIVINPSFIQVQAFLDGLAAVQGENGKWGFIDKTGTLVIPAKYYHVKWVDKRTAAVTEDKGSNSIIIDRNGNKVRDLDLSIPEYYIGEFSEGLATIEKKDTDLHGYIDESWKIIITPRADLGASEFKGGYALSSRQKYENQTTLYPLVFAFYDKKGKFETEFRYSWAEDFIEGKAWVVEDEEFANDPTHPENRRGHPSHFVGVDFKEAFPLLNYEAVGSFSEGLAPVRILESGKVGFIDKNGKIVIEPQFNKAYPFISSMAWVQLKKDGDWGFIDKTGNIVIKPQWTEMDKSDFYDELIWIRIPGERNKGYMNKKGEFVYKQNS